MRLRRLVPAVLAICVGILAPTGAAQPPDAAPPEPLQRMIETERAFAARALVVGWKQAFLEHFADDAIGFAQGEVGLAKEQIRTQPDPPKDHQLLWEPRYGDVSGSGDMGYLTGPARRIVPNRNKGQPQHMNYMSVWKRQRDGTFKVVMDVGVPTPAAPAFAPGFTRAPHQNRFTGDYDERTPPLGTSDGVMNSDLRSSPTRALRGRLAEGARLHRPNIAPRVGERSIMTWVAGQPAFASSDTRFAESSRAGDLGYTWGTYSIAARRGARAERGFYVRVWVRDRGGQWKLAVDVLQPQ